MYRNVMVPVDGSPFSREAVLHGLRIASRSGATLRLVRVGTASILSSGAEGAATESRALREIQARELAELYSIAAECRAHSTVAVTASLQYGPVVDALVGYARRNAVDLIVIRSHGRKGFARAWFGSVADGLIRESGVPVLVVKAPSVATAVESGFAYKRILIPLDGSLLAEQSIEPVLSLARVYGSSITLLKIIPAAAAGSSSELQSSLGPAPASEVACAARYLETCLGGERSIPISRRLMISNDIPGTILSVAESMAADMIAIATHGRGAIARAAVGSVADQVAREAPVSTMVVHPVLKGTEFQREAIESRLAIA